MRLTFKQNARQIVYFRSFVYITANLNVFAEEQF